MKLYKKGFTLIELLVVVAILGILAAGVLIAINPVKKINSAKDATVKTDLSQVVQALNAYYTTNTYYPAGTSAVALADLVTKGEIKGVPTDVTYVAGTTVSGAGVSDAALWGTILIPVTVTPGSGATPIYWCWDSTTGQAKETLTKPSSVAAPSC